MPTSEFRCPFCFEWISKENFDKHIYTHPDPVAMSIGFVDRPATIEEMKRRFDPLGFYLER